jgi:hypothetical protein
MVMDWFAGNAGHAKDVNLFDRGETASLDDAGILPRTLVWLKQHVELQRGRAILWSAVGLATGLLAYFSLSVEPAIAATLMMLTVAVCLLVG